MTFKKLVLASAILAASGSALAVDVLDDEMLSGVTGQDGIQVMLDLNLTAGMVVHDTSGLAGVDSKYLVADYAPITDILDPGYNPALDPSNIAYDPILAAAAETAYYADPANAYAFAGAMVIDGFGLDTTASLNGVEVNIDVGDNADGSAPGSNPTLNIGVNIGANTILTTGDIYVANSQRDNASAWGVTNLGAQAVVDSATVTLGDTDINIQLGNEPQGHMIRLDTVIWGGLQITGGAIRDINSGGTLGAASISISDAGASDLTVDVGIDVVGDAGPDGAGLQITLNQVGHATNGLDVRMERVALGSSTPGYIGDVEMTGLNISAGTILIRGK